MTPAVLPNLCISMKIFLKHQVNWYTACGAIQDLSWRNIWLVDNPVQVLSEHLSLLVGCFVPSQVICLRNKDKPWFDDQCHHAFDLNRMLIFDGLVIAFGSTRKSLPAVK